MTIKAVVHKAEEGGYWAEVPALEAGAPKSTSNTDDQILELAM